MLILLAPGKYLPACMFWNFRVNTALSPQTGLALQFCPGVGGPSHSKNFLQFYFPKAQKSCRSCGLAAVLCLPVATRGQRAP